MFVIVTSLLISIYLELIVFMHRVYIRFSNFFEGRGNTAPSRSIPDRILCLWYISGLLCNSLKIVARGHVSVDTARRH